ncbi:MAG: oligosaccharide flippase family protein [Sedimentisphaerales bacterium]|nr:oligosaccharide flippase family protein [Sedimentisphaerales bacterium]
MHNTFYNVAMLMANAILAFVLIRFFLGRLGEAKYGVWVLIGSVFRYRIVLGMGLNSAINRRIPMYLAKGDEQGVQSVVSTALLFFSLVALVLVLLTLLLYFKIGDWFAIEAELVPAARWLVLIVGLSFAASTPVQLATALLSGLQRFDVISIVTLITLTIRTALLVVLMLRGYGLLTLGYIYGISEVVARAVQYFYARRLLPTISVAWKSVNRTLLKEMLCYGMNTFLYATGTLIVYRASETIIGIFLGTAEVAQFSVAAAGVLLLSQFVQAFTAAIKPAVSDLDARDDQVRVRQIAFLTQKYSLLLLIPAVTFLAVMGRDFLTVWVGKEFTDPGVLASLTAVLTILAAGHGLMLAQHSNFLVLAGRGEHKVFGVLTAVEALLCIVGAVLSVKVAGWGLTGVAWCNFAPMALVAGVVLPAYFNRRMKIRTWDTLRQVWWPALLGSVPGLAIIILWKYLAPPDSWLKLFGVVAATGIVTCVCAWFISLQSAERRMFLHVAGRRSADPV